MIWLEWPFKKSTICFTSLAKENAKMRGQTHVRVAQFFSITVFNLLKHYGYVFHCCHRNLFACLWRHRHVKSKIYFWVAEKAYLLIFSMLCPNCCPNRDSWKTFDIGHHIWMSLKVICQVSSENMSWYRFPRIRIGLHKC